MRIIAGIMSVMIAITFVGAAWILAMVLGSFDSWLSIVGLLLGLGLSLALLELVRRLGWIELFFVNLRMLLFADAVAYNNRGLYMLDRGVLDRAMDDFDEAITLDSNLAVAFSNRCLTWICQRELDNAIKDANVAIQLDPNLPHAYSNRALALIGKSELDLAIEDCDESIRLAPRFAEGYANRATAHLQNMMFEHALSDANCALDFDPRKQIVYETRANALFNLGFFKEAASDFTRALKYTPEEPPLLSGRGLARHRLGQYRQALADYNEAVRLWGDGPGAAVIYNNRGFTYHAIGRFNDAVIDYERAVQLDENHPNAYKNYAWLLATCPDDNYRDGQRAVQLATKAHDLIDWQQTPWLYILAAAYAESGQFPQAIQWQQKTIEAAAEEDRQVEEDRLKLYQAGQPIRESAT